MSQLAVVNLLGTFSVRSARGAPQIARKTRALIGFLAARGGRPVPREEVAETLWPDTDADKSRHNLRQALTVLRSTIGPPDFIIAEGSMLTMQGGAVECDLLHLLRLIRSDAADDLARAGLLYAGPLLAGLPPVTPMFDDWLARTRVELQERVLLALGRLFDARFSANEATAAIDISERMLAIDPLREDSQRKRMLALAKAGRRSDALRLFSDSQALLRRELDVAPSLETRELAERIRQENASADGGLIASLPAAVRAGMIPMVAVLPLRQFGDRDIPSHISEGLVTDIVCQLAGLRELGVISHGSTLGFRDDRTDVREIGRRLGARYIVRGMIRTAGCEMRLTTELTDAATGAVEWARQSDIDGPLTFAAQDRVVAQVVNALTPRVHELELRRIRGQRPDSLSVYEKVLVAREAITTLRKDEFMAARGLLTEAILEEPTYSEAYALAADWHGLLVAEGWSQTPEADTAAIETLSRHALTHNPDNVRALVFYGHRKSLLHRDYASAQHMFQHALDVAPGSAMAWLWSSYTASYVGDAADGIRRAEHALSLSPSDREAHSFYFALCLAHYTGGDYETAAEWGFKAMAEKTMLRSTPGWLAASLVGAGRVAEAREVAARMMQEWPERRVRDVVARHPYRDAGRREGYGAHLVAAGCPL